MNKYIFTITASGDRTNIMASFPLWDKETFIEQVKKGKNCGRYRYGKIGGYISLVKDMSLEEFDELFTSDTFTKKEITEIFRKEISLKYGEHGDKAKIKPISKKELERGCVYEDFTGQKWLYYGEVERTVDRKRYTSEKKPVDIEKGLGFGWLYSNSPNEGRWDINILKSPKKLLKKIEGIKIELKPEYVYETGERYYGYSEHRTVLKLL